MDMEDGAPAKEKLVVSQAMRRSFVGILAAATAIALIVGLMAWFIGSEPQATQVVTGVVISWVNIFFYALITALFLAKKNVALAIPLIVIKYVLLVWIVYYIWASSDVVLVLVGVFSELILTALILLPFKRFLVS